MSLFDFHCQGNFPVPENSLEENLLIFNSKQWRSFSPTIFIKSLINYFVSFPNGDPDNLRYCLSFIKRLQNGTKLNYLTFIMERRNLRACGVWSLLAYFVSWIEFSSWWMCHVPPSRNTITICTIIILRIAKFNVLSTEMLTVTSVRCQYRLLTRGQFYFFTSPWQKKMHIFELKVLIISSNDFLFVCFFAIFQIGEFGVEQYTI